MQGVELIIEPSTPIPTWIQKYNDVHLEIRPVNRGVKQRLVRSLKIFDAQVFFVPTGGVDIIHHLLSDNSLALFAKLDIVLEICDLDGKLLQRNYHLCKACFTLTGECKIREQSTSMPTRNNETFRCVTCKQEWLLENI